MCKPQQATLEANLDFLSSSSPELYQQLSRLSDQVLGWSLIGWEANNDYVFKGKSSVSLLLNGEIIPRLNHQYEQGRSIKLSRLISEAPVEDNVEILNRILDSDSYALSSSLFDESLFGKQADDKDFRFSDAVILFGSLAMIPFSDKSILGDTANYPPVIVLYENNLEELYALLSLVDLAEYFQACKKRDVKFILEYSESLDELKDKIFNFFYAIRPLAMASTMAISSSFDISNEVLQSYSMSSEGLGQRLLSGLGSSTDEFNQLLHGLCNSLHLNRKILLSSTKDQGTVCIVGSGPSLDLSIEEILNIKDKNIQIFAAGSSVGALLRNNISPDVVILVERSKEVLNDLQELINEGYSFKETTLIYAQNIHPDIPLMFKMSIAYHRPLSASTPLFPDESDSTLMHAGPLSVNAAFDVACHQGFQKIILAGCDFSGTSSSDRASKAVGLSERELTIPMRSNKSSTLLTNSQLIQSRNVLLASKNAYPDVDIVRIGTGLPIPEEEKYENIETEYSLCTTIQSISERNCPIQTYSIEQISQKCDMLLEASHDYFHCLYGLLNEAPSWKQIDHTKLAEHLVIDHQSNTSRPSTEVIVRLNRQIIVNILVHLFDANLTSQMWNQHKIIILSALERLEAINKSWIVFCKQCVSSFPARSYTDLTKNYMQKSS